MANVTVNVPSRSSPVRRAVVMLMALAVLLPLLSSLPVTGGPLPIQPQLRQVVDGRPDDTVRIIVWKRAEGVGIEDAVARLGGTVVHDLYMIGALAVELPGQAIPSLARHRAVARISLDAPVIDSGEPVEAAGNRRGSAGQTRLYIPVTVGRGGGTRHWSLEGERRQNAEPPGQPAATPAATEPEASPAPSTPTATEPEAPPAPSTPTPADNQVPATPQPNDDPDPTSTATPADPAGATPTASPTSPPPTSTPEPLSYECEDGADHDSYYVTAICADRLRAERPELTGQGMTVAIVDSGVNDHKDLREGWEKQASKESRIIRRLKFNSKANYATDEYGHGTHIGGIIGGNGMKSAGTYVGVAPDVNIISLKVSDDKGAGHTSDVVAGLQWIYEEHEKWNIRVVNVSLNSGIAESYHESPLTAALEVLWFNGIVVVVSGGNNGADDNGILYPPSNDPFLISVGATDEMGNVAYYSAYGTTDSGFNKPDLVAPGSDIVSTLAHYNTWLAKAHPDHLSKEAEYFRMSGTSMAAGVTTGAIVLLLQAEPDLTPDQVKHRLMATAKEIDHPGAGAGQLDIYAAVNRPSTGSANTGIEASRLLWSGEDPVTWDSVTWNSVNWSSVNWSSVNWSSVNWSSVNWSSVNWD